MSDEYTPFQTGNFRQLGEWGGVVDYGRNRRNMVLFYNRPVSAPSKSTAAGRPVYEEKVYVRIQEPGDRTTVVDRPATDADKRDYALQWAQFQQNKEQIPEGTPIDLLYPEHPAVAATLRANGVHTIEQCADLSGNAIDNIGMGCQRYVNDAQKYMKLSERGVKATEFRREIEDRDSKIRVLQQQVEQLSAEVNRLTQNATNQPNLAQIQQLLAGAMTRPMHMPGQGFDSAAAQIHANHPTTDITRQRRQRKKAV
jgi:hypothetical protein